LQLVQQQIICGQLWPYHIAMILQGTGVSQLVDPYSDMTLQMHISNKIETYETAASTILLFVFPVL
jgi:hypothetical protein